MLHFANGKGGALSVRFARERRMKMGFTRYWYREPEISVETMRMIVDDSGKIVLPLDDHGVHMAGPIGEGAPEISIERIAFNGLTTCGHAKNTKVVIPWPTPDAAGLSSPRAVIVGEHAGGVFIDSRTCMARAGTKRFSLSALRQRRIGRNPCRTSTGEAIAAARPPFDHTISPSAQYF